jgi:hypothetical protein
LLCRWLSLASPETAAAGKFGGSLRERAGQCGAVVRTLHHLPATSMPLLLASFLTMATSEKGEAGDQQGQRKKANGRQHEEKQKLVGLELTIE